VLEVVAADGRGRIASWTPSEGFRLVGPALVWPENSLLQPPAWIQAVVAPHPTGRKGVVEILSGGTWFYPLEQQGPLVLQPPRPAPTTQVQLLTLGDDVAVFHDAGGWASNPRNLVKALIEAARAATPGRMLWAPALGVPADYALWVYLGVDLFDASPLLLAATRGEALTSDGTLAAKDAERVAGHSLPFEALAAMNLESARQELALIQHHIAQGTLRSLVEKRVYNSPGSVEILRRFDREHHFLEAATPRHRAVPLPAITADALWSPEVEAFRRTFRDRYEPPAGARVLALIPCSQRKPYKLSRSHRLIARVLDDSGIRPLLHEVMITSPLGLVPRELEEVYPANQYDIPVTGHWMRDEEAIVREQLAALLSKHDYGHVVVHAGQATFDILRDLLPDHVRHTCLHHPTSREDLQRLAQELARLKGELGGVDAWAVGRQRKVADLRALASFQFGPAVAAALTDGAQGHGRAPYTKLERNGVQLGQTTPDRGVLSLTLEGAKALAAHRTKRVFIGDFRPKGTSTLFAVGVEGADPDVRPGDEVVVLHKDEVRGCGVAHMSGEAMTHLKRGIAVTLRHTVAAEKPAKKTVEVAA
jgi:archaeosine synthase